MIKKQIPSTQIASFDRLISLAEGLAKSVESLSQLNCHTIRSTFTATFDHVLLVRSTKDPRDWMAFPYGLTASAADQVQNYNRELLNIITATQTEFARFMQAQWAAYENRTTMLAENAVTAAPMRSEATVAPLESSITAADAQCESLQKNGVRVVEMTRNSFDVATATASKPPKQASAAPTSPAKR